MGKGARLKVEYEVIVRDKKGKVLQRERRVSKSLLANFMRWLRQWFTITVVTGYATSFTMTDTGNVGRTCPRTGVNEQGRFSHMGADVNIATKGLVVGTGTASVSPTDYALQAQIAQGTGSGQMVHGAVTVEDVEVVGSVSRFRVTRVFTNNSGASITVREIGAYFSQNDTTPAERFFCMLRDVLVSPSTVPDGASLTVRYRFVVTA